jgi:hypothetical protein
MMETKWTNDRKRSRNGYPSVGGPLENKDKARICIKAREAFDKADTRQDFETWRRHEQFIAVTGANPLLDRTSRLSLRDCTQRDVLKLVAHFEDLAGQPGRAIDAHMRDEMKDSSIAMRKLEVECAERGLDLSYPAKICQKQYKCALEDAAPNQLWRLVFTVRNRRKVRREMECPF